MAGSGHCTSECVTMDLAASDAKAKRLGQSISSVNTEM